MRALGVVALTVLTAAAAASPASAASPAPRTVVSDACPRAPVDPQAGHFVERSVQVRSRPDGQALEATVFRPGDRRRFAGRRPAIVFQHGLGGSQCGQFWAARALAGAGYVTLAVSAADGVEPKVRAIAGGIDFLVSAANPFRRMVRARRIGAAGHSQGANAVSLAQALETRIDAIVAFDNLHRWVDGDPGVFLGCRGRPRNEIPPRVPAMGQALDGPCVNRPAERSPQLKKPGFDHWRAAGLPTMQLVFRDAQHDDWGGGAAADQPETERRRLFAYYATAWFDRWLLGRPAATRRLLAGSVLGRPATDVLSTQFLSGAAFPGASGCAADLRACLR